MQSYKDKYACANRECKRYGLLQRAETVDHTCTACVRPLAVRMTRCERHGGYHAPPACPPAEGVPA